MLESRPTSLYGLDERAFTAYKLTDASLYSFGGNGHKTGRSLFISR